MSQYRECPICHAALDPGEHCDCDVQTDAPLKLDDTDTDEERM
ncbi:MAG TPA: hypothetical protein PKJ47_12530 [Candidatus Limiplasma sp.]|nr:hypothetical protein [Candidatus Limiplasma sp.]